MWVQDVYKSFKLKNTIHVFFFFFSFGIDGHDILVITTSYTKQCFVRVLVDGTKAFDKRIPSNAYILVRKWMQISCKLCCVTLVYNAMFLVKIIECAFVRIEYIRGFGC